MKYFKGISIELPTVFLEDETRKNIRFFFKNYPCVQNNNYSNFLHLKCFLEIGKIYLNPIICEVLNTSNFLIQIKIREKTNVIKRIFFFLKLKKFLKFRKFFDFYFTASTNLKSLDQKKNFIEPKKKVRMCFVNEKCIPIDLIPFFFSKNLDFLKNKSLKINFSSFFKNSHVTRYLNKNFPEMTFNAKLEIDARSLQIKKNISIKYIINFQTEKNPKFPFKRLKKKLFFAPFFAIGFTLKLFKKRPIWTLEILEKFFPSSLKRYLKKILPCLSYCFHSINPFQKTWIRLGFDPRKKKNSFIYQTLEKKKNYRNSEKNFSIWFQICDIPNPKLKKFLIGKKKNNLYKKNFIHLFKGWFSQWEFVSLKKKTSILK
jgi:hypothetical protein